jgi:hypothetical protein
MDSPLQCNWTKDPGGWRCKRCDFLFPYATEQPPRRNCGPTPEPASVAKPVDRRAFILRKVEEVSSHMGIPYGEISDAVEETVDQCLGGCAHFVDGRCDLALGSGCRGRASYVQLLATYRGRCLEVVQVERQSGKAP